MSSNALVPIDTDPAEIVARASNTANACRAIVRQNTMALQGKQYIKSEGWQALAAACGYSPRIEKVEELENGDVRAMCALVRLSDGEVVAQAEGYVGTDEHLWAKRPRYARRAMAQTRATGRACRSALAWIVPLLDMGLETTPAEEIPHDLPHEPAAPPAKPDEKDALLKDINRLMLQVSKATGVTTTKLAEDMRGAYGVKSSKDLTVDQLREVIASLQEQSQGA